MTKDNTTYNFEEIFGLTEEQLKILFSIEYDITENDINKYTTEKHKKEKRNWLSIWKSNLYRELYYGKKDIQSHIKEEVKKNSSNKTWLYIVLLESMCFVPYVTSQDNKNKNELKFKNQDERIKDLFNCNVIDIEYVERFRKTFKSSLFKLSGGLQKIFVSVLITTAVAALTYGVAAVSAGGIAVALFGENFAGLSGAALTSACLSYAGGGAIAAGGAGMAGGVAAIATCGAFVGAGAGGIASFAYNMALKEPKYVLFQAAKLEVVIKEIVLNIQKDIFTAQRILEKYKEQINELNKKLKEEELKNSKNKESIDNLKKSISYMEKMYKESTRFSSSWAEGVGHGK